MTLEPAVVDLGARVVLFCFAAMIFCLLASAAVEDYRQDRAAWKRRAKRWKG